MSSKLSADDIRKMSKWYIDGAEKELSRLYIDLQGLMNRWDEGNIIYNKLQAMGGNQYDDYDEKQLPIQKRRAIKKLQDEWWQKVDDNTKIKEELNSRFIGIVNTLFYFYKRLPTQKRKYFNEMDTHNVRKNCADIIQEYTFHNHMTIKPPSYLMEWIGFKWNKGWHYT